MKKKLFPNRNIQLPLNFVPAIEEFLSGQLPAGVLMELIASFSKTERWLLLVYLLEQRNLNPVHFFHIPKTGGTTLGESLARDKKAVVVSVDSTDDMFVRQLATLRDCHSGQFVLTRAHHSLKVLDSTGAFAQFSFVFSTYRDPLSIHVSNVNMIMRRLDNFSKEKPMPEAETDFCVDWMAKLKGEFKYSRDFALNLLKSEIYADQMGSVYRKHYNLHGWKRLITDKKLLVIDAASVDQLFTDVFGYQYPPERRNVSSVPLLQLDEIEQRHYKHLIRHDQDISAFLVANLSEVSTLGEFLGYEQYDN